MYINLGRFLSGELLQLIFFCEYWRLFHTSSCGPLIILYLLYLVFTVLFRYSMSMALFQYNVMCTEPNEVTPYVTWYLEYKENGHCYRCTKRQVTAKQEDVEHFLYFLNGIISVNAVVLTAERSGHFFCHHCRVFCKTFMLWSYCF